MLIWWWQALLGEADLSDQPEGGSATACVSGMSTPALCACCTARLSSMHVASWRIMDSMPALDQALRVLKGWGT